MLLKLVPYGKHFHKQCLKLMMETWNFDPVFPHLKVPGLINELYFDESIIGANYSQVLVDENGRVHGFAFGMVKPSLGWKIKGAIQSLLLVLTKLLHFLVGNFGPRDQVLSSYHDINQLDHEVTELRRNNDAYLSLFLVRVSLRGQGWGRRLLERFASHAQEKGCKRLYLWTDKGSNYRFYDKLGFTRIKTISSAALNIYGDGPNGFVYVKPLAQEG